MNEIENQIIFLFFRKIISALLSSGKHAVKIVALFVALSEFICFSCRFPLQYKQYVKGTGGRYGTAIL